MIVSVSLLLSVMSLLSFFSSPGQSPGRAIVLPPASALVVVSKMLKFLYARLKNGRIMLYPLASVRLSVRLSVCKLFRFHVTPPTVYIRLS